MPNPNFFLPLDLSGIKPENKIINEIHQTTVGNFRIIFPKFGAYFASTLVVKSVNTSTGAKTTLTKGQHYYPTEMLHKTTFQLGKEIQCAILITDNVLPNTFEIEYQALGGSDSPNRDILLDEVDRVVNRKDLTDWNSIIKPKEFPAAHHLQDAADLYGMEYIVNALERVKEAVLISDTAFHIQILQYQQIEAADAFYAEFNVAINDQIDIITAQCDSVTNTHKVMDGIHLQIEDELKESDAIIKESHRRNAVYELQSDNAQYALTLAHIAKVQKNFNNSIMNLPTFIDDLYFYVDFTDTNAVTVSGSNVTARDRSYHNRVFSGTGVTLQNNVVINKRCGRFKNNHVLNQTSGVPVTLKSNQTIFTITANHDALEELHLLSNATHSLKTNITNGDLLGLTNTAGTTASSLIRCSLDNKRKHHVIVMGVSNDLRKSVAYSNAVESTYRGKEGFDIYPDYQTSEFNMTRIGHPSQTQNSDLALILIYDRLLSKYEIDAILAWIDLRFGVKTNLIANDHFDDQLAEFETTYRLTTHAEQKGDIAIGDKYILNMCANGKVPMYKYPNFMQYLTNLDEQDHVLLVNTGLDQTKPFWVQKHQLDPYARYVFSVKVMFDPANKPNINLYLNNVKHPKTITLPDIGNNFFVMEFDFTPTQEDVTLSLRNLKTVTNDSPVNTFIIDHIRLNRVFN